MESECSEAWRGFPGLDKLWRGKLDRGTFQKGTAESKKDGM